MQLCANEAAWCLLQAGFTPDESRRGIAVGWAESELQTLAIGHVLGRAGFKGNMDLGWLQLSNYWHHAKLLDHPDWRDPVDNARVARLIFLEKQRIQKNRGEPLDGWMAWKGYGSFVDNVWVPNGRYTAALPFADVGMKAPFRPIMPEELVFRRVLGGLDNPSA